MGVFITPKDVRPKHSKSPPGPRLMAPTQLLVYNHLLDLSSKDTPVRRGGTQKMIKRTQRASRRSHSRPSKVSNLWLALWSPYIPQKKIWSFLWKLMHNALLCGAMWLRATGYEDRAHCPACGVIKLPSHILTKCKASGQAYVWPMVQKLLRDKGIQWSEPRGVGDLLLLPNPPLTKVKTRGSCRL